MFWKVPGKFPGVPGEVSARVCDVLESSREVPGGITVLMLNPVASSNSTCAFRL